MPRYFFDIHDGFVVIDDFGRDLPDLEAARIEAMRIAGSFSTNPQMIGEEGGVMVVVVRDGPDNVVLKIRLAFNIETVQSILNETAPRPGGVRGESRGL